MVDKFKVNGINGSNGEIEEDVLECKKVLKKVKKE